MEFPVVERIPMQWGDMDALGHANNAKYFVWFESARIAYFGRVGLEALKPTKVGPILASTKCDFKAPLVYPADLEVGVSVVRLGNKSFTMKYAVTAGGVLHAEGEGIIVIYDYEKAQTVPIPEAVRAAIEALEA